MLKYDCLTGSIESSPDENHKFVEHKLLQIGDILYIFAKTPLTAYKFDATAPAHISNKIKLASVSHRRSGFALANYQDSAIYITGGLVPCGGPTDSVLKFKLISNTFSEVCSLNVARLDHSSTSVGNIVAVFGGRTRSTYLDASIEVLDVTCMPQPRTWQMVTSRAFTARMLPLVCPLNRSQIVISGGADDRHLLNDILVFDTTTNLVKKVAKAPFRFNCLNQTYIEGGTDSKFIVSMVYGEE